MSKSFSRLIGAAVVALSAAAMLWREVSHYNPGFAQFAAYTPSLEGALSITQRKEMIEIQRQDHLASQIKVHPSEGSEKPLLGSNCYVGSTRNRSMASANAGVVRRGLCAHAELKTNPRTEFNEQNQLNALLV